MKIIKAITCLAIVSIHLAACSEQESADSGLVANPPLHPSSVQTKEKTIPDQPVSGIIHGEPFLIGRAILTDGRLVMRQGDDFFADRAITIWLPQKESYEDQAVSVSEGDGFEAPKISISYKAAGSDLPTSEFVSDAYRMRLEFGSPSELGVPFGIDLLIPHSPQTKASGRFFAAYSDVRVIDGDVDLLLDTFDTLRFVATNWIKQNRAEVVPYLGEDFGVSIRAFGNPEYLKTGFIGYEVANTGGTAVPVKLQLLKDENGWRVFNALKADEISPAHPVVAGVSRQDTEQAAAELVASLELERELNTSGTMPAVRYTDMKCRLGGEAGRASCRATYSIKITDTTACKTSNWLLGHEQKGWTVLQSIKDTQRVNYRTGELEDYKPFGANCG